MTAEPHTPTGCFSAFNFMKSLLPKTLARTRANLDDQLRQVDNKNNQLRELFDTNLTSCGCSGDDWNIISKTPPSYLPPPAYNVSGKRATELDPEILKTVESKLKDIAPALYNLSINIHENPELGYEEKHASKVLTEFLAKHGFDVTFPYEELDTAWRAEYSSGEGGRVLGVNSEMDALPGIGHACGHNLIAISGLGVAVAVKAALETHKLPGKVIILGTPAEEGGGGKIKLLNKGAYKDMDVCLMSHPGPGEINSSGDGPMTASQTMYVTYKGKSAHAAASPWEGINALDAAVSVHNSVSSLRQQLKPELRVHGIIEGTDWAPNVIPDNAKLTYMARAPTQKDLADLAERLRNCFMAAALATGCEVSIQMKDAYLDLRQNPVLGKEYGKMSVEHCDMIFHHGGSSGSTDFGNVSYELPSLHPLYTIPTEPNGGNHTPAFTRSARTKTAHIATLKVTKALALAGLRVLTDPVFFDEVMEAFEVEKKAASAMLQEMR